MKNLILIFMGMATAGCTSGFRVANSAGQTTGVSANIEPGSAGPQGPAGATGATGPQGPTGASDCVSIISYGGVGDGSTDNAAAIQAALVALPVTGGCIYFPSGKYEISTAISYSLSASAVDSVSFLGAGADATTLAWPNSGGGLTFNYNGLGDSVHIRDVAITVGQPNGGIGVNLYQNYVAPGASTGYNAVSDFTSVTFRGDDGYVQSDYWSTALNITVSNVNVQSSEVDGPAGAYSTTGNGIVISGDAIGIYAVALNVTNTNFNELNAGILYGTGTQGITVSGGNFTGVNYGIASNGGETGLSQLSVSNSQFNASGAGIMTVTGIPALSVTSTYFLIPTNAVGINMAQSSSFEIDDNNFQALGSNANGVVVSGSTGGGGIITGNEFLGLTTGVWLQSSSSQVNVQSNSYTGDSTQVLNQGTANTVGGGSD